MRRIAVIEAGLVPDELLNRYDSYPVMVQHWLAPHLPDTTFHTISVIQVDSFGHPADFDAYVITGSKHVVYDDLPWIAPLRRFIQAVAARHIPQIGICFGHQILAEALGGKVEKSSKGWAIGVRDYNLDPSMFDPGDMPLLAYHQDQVVVAPPNTRVIVSNSFCPLGGFVYQDTPVLSVQFHPEFANDYVAALLHLRGGSDLPTEISNQALATLERGTDSAAVGAATAKFLQTHFGVASGNTTQVGQPA